MKPAVYVLAWLVILSSLSGCASGKGVVQAARGLNPTSNVIPPPTRVRTITPSPIPSVTPSLLPSQTLPPTFTPFVITPPTSTGPWIVGFSGQGRPIEVYQFGSGKTQRMIVAGIHGGNEWNTTELARKLIEHLTVHPELVPKDKTLYILPLLNPDGEARAHGVDGRVNNNGVDLNRNWDYNWQADWPKDGCWIFRPVTAGKFAGSETETSALVSFIKTHPIDALISYHSAALGIFPAGIPPEPRSIKLAEAVAEVSPYPYPPIDTGCLFTGNMVDWASTRGIAALDIELSDHKHTDFDINLRILEVFLNWSAN